MIEKYFNKSVSIKEEYCEPLFEVFVAMIYADYLSYLSDSGKDKSEKEKELGQLLAATDFSKLPDTLVNMENELKMALYFGDTHELKRLANLLQY